MAKIQITSDLHIEHQNDSVPNPLKYITPSAEVLILAGDIGSLYKYEQLREFLKKICSYFQVVLYIPGNHEYYTMPNIPVISMNSLNTRLSQLEKDIHNLYILNCSSVRIGNLCIIGSTLWSKPDINIPRYIVRINQITNEIYENMYNKDLKYTTKMIEYCKEHKYKLLVVTHHCPTFKTLEGSKKRAKNHSLYASDLDHLLTKDKVDTWVCGHVHNNFDFVSEGGTRIVGNQKGKPKDKIDDFRKDFVIIL